MSWACCIWRVFLGYFGSRYHEVAHSVKDFSPDSDSYRGSYSDRGGGRRTTLADWTWHEGAIAGCSGRGAIAACHRRVPL